MEKTTPYGEWDNLPNRLTLFRILMVPLLIGPLYLSDNFSWGMTHQKTLGYVSAWLFTIAALTDIFDGHIARKQKIVTVFGSFLDPIADKFLVVSSLIVLQAMDRIPVFVVIVLVMREFYITSLRLLAKERNLSIPSSFLGKLKTIFQMTGIPFLMAYDNPWNIFPMPLIGIALIYLACLFSLYSALQYSMGIVKTLRTKKKQTSNDPI